MGKDCSFLILINVDEPNRNNLGRRYVISSQGSTLGTQLNADIHLNTIDDRETLVKIGKNGSHWYIDDLSDFSEALINGIISQNSHIYNGDILAINGLSFEFCTTESPKVQYFEAVENLLQEDFLTRAYNRSFLFNLLSLETTRYNRLAEGSVKNLSPYTPPPISIIFIDVDHFGALNKEHGHWVGDEILRSLVIRIKSCLRSIDIVARYGGEEFVILLLDTQLEQAKKIAETIRSCIANTPFLVDTVPVHTTVSAGVAEFQPGMTKESFLQAADTKLRQAKRAGRNQIIS